MRLPRPIALVFAGATFGAACTPAAQAQGIRDARVAVGAGLVDLTAPGGVLHVPLLGGWFAVGAAASTRGGSGQVQLQVPIREPDGATSVRYLAAVQTRYWRRDSVWRAREGTAVLVGLQHWGTREGDGPALFYDMAIGPRFFRGGSVGGYLMSGTIRLTVGAVY